MILITIKNHVVTIAFLCLSLFSLAQSGWRPDEMEVKVVIENKSDAVLLGNLKFDTDFYPGYAIVYAIPTELKQLKESGLKVDVIVDDLNSKSDNFWKGRDEYSSYFAENYEHEWQNCQNLTEFKTKQR